MSSPCPAPKESSPPIEHSKPLSTAAALIEAHSRSAELQRQLHALNHPLIFPATATELEISIYDPDIIDRLRELVKKGIMEGVIDGKKVNVGGLGVECLKEIAKK